MKLAEIDYISNSNLSLLHRTNPAAKMIFSIALLTSVIISDQWSKLLFLIAVLAVFFIASRIPLKLVLHLVLYALIFSTLFAFIAAKQSWQLGVVVILKAIGASLTTIWLITTTPYVDVFSIFSLFMPRIMIDIFIFTYRSFFVLIEKMERLFKNIQLRGGYHPLRLIMNLRNIASIIGMFILYAFEMSERMYHIYSLRGYNGVLPINVDIWPFKGKDLLITAFGVLILIGVIVL
jgi:cobalt/nickel transport system permease protein